VVQGVVVVDTVVVAVAVAVAGTVGTNHAGSYFVKRLTSFLKYKNLKRHNPLYFLGQ
jgi:hypothetical protein